MGVGRAIKKLKNDLTAEEKNGRSSGTPHIQQVKDFPPCASQRLKASGYSPQAS